MARMPVVLSLTVVAILAGVLVVAKGRGGELALPRPDSAAYGQPLVTAADVASFRPPAAFLGYSAQATDEALRRIARSVAERDAELAMLRHEIAVLRSRQYEAGGPGTLAGPAGPGTFAGPAGPGTFAGHDGAGPVAGPGPATGPEARTDSDDAGPAGVGEEWDTDPGTAG